MASGTMQSEGSTAMTDQLYTTHDISRLLQVDPSTVSKWIDRGILMAFRTPGGHRRVRSTDLRTFLVTHQMPVPEELGSSTVRLLIVDDERQTLDAIKRAFKPYANQVEIQTTTSGVEALLLVSEQKPHGMLMDINMPDIDGIEVCKRIRARKQMEGVRLITMTSNHTPDVVEQSKQAGAVACLAKPLDVNAVLELFRVPMALGASANRK
ncbi:response regulator [Corallococcus praedator]|uniref:Response regulator n=3 Tax=Corallococcus TaxID=83461 RepID=A0A3A8IV21_9BACT|nr:MULTISPECIES: response regulator [Corallococcus]RYZ35673.1 MAG: response regulator [Myxococcaceae bacterium]MBE4747435.1 response regulator [Corallococcus soli]MCY1036290.1 response regulator [Corallococcus sp. BB11-1]MCY1044306.1 response regulator [Corallococcus sp. bb12-1]RKG87389.1 response regulator [Corallococcus terminator]